MVISKKDEKLLEGGIFISIQYDYDSEGVYIDEDELREEFENKLEELMSIGVCECGFCGETLVKPITQRVYKRLFLILELPINLDYIIIK